MTYRVFVAETARAANPIAAIRNRDVGSTRPVDSVETPAAKLKIVVT